MSTHDTMPVKGASTDVIGQLVENAYNDEPVYSSNQVAAIVAAKVSEECERCEMKLQVTRADVSLVAGEMSAQEWRTCAAVLRWMQARIRDKPRQTRAELIAQLEAERDELLTESLQFPRTHLLR